MLIYNYQKKIIMITIILTILFNLFTQSNAYTGEITSYGAMNTNQFCGFIDSSWNYNNLMTAAINGKQIDNSLSCGLCAAVTYNNKTEIVLIDNMCPECKHGDLDLSQQAWEKLTGNRNFGREKASWEFVTCDRFLKDEKNIILRPYSINYWWLSINPSNLLCGMEKMFISFKDENWIEMERKNEKMNGLYFIYHNQVIPPFKFKLINLYGEEIITENYNEIQQIFNIGKQFSCSSEDCIVDIPTNLACS